MKTETEIRQLAESTKILLRQNSDDYYLKHHFGIKLETLEWVLGEKV